MNRQNEAARAAAGRRLWAALLAPLPRPDAHGDAPAGTGAVAEGTKGTDHTQYTTPADTRTAVRQ
jgi:hypothetical protein